MSHVRCSRTCAAVLVLVAALLAVPAFAVDPAQPAERMAPTTTAVTTRPPVPTVKLDCSVQGTPVEFPDDVYIRNVGLSTIVKGTKVDWSADGTTYKGVYTLPADLTPGAGTFASGVIGGGLGAGHKCTCKIASTTSTLAARPVRGTLTPMLAYSLGCVVQGTPVEFPDDIYLTNKGASVIPKGKIVHWSIPGTTRQGDYTLAADLLAGKGLLVSGVIGGGMGAGTPCTATVK